MLCVACGRDHEALAAQLGSRALECLAGENGPPRTSAGYEQINATQGSSAFAPPSDASSSAAVDCRAVEPNAWVQSLKRAQQRCAALAEAAARDRAARAAQRKGAVADRRAFMLPAQALTVSQLPIVPRSPMPEPSRPEEPNKFDSLWDNLASGVASSPAATSTFEQPIEQESLPPSELTPVPATRDQTPVAPLEPMLQSLASPNEQTNEGASVAPSDLASSSVTDRENIEQPQEQAPQPLACTSSADHSIDVSSVLPAVPVPDLPTSCQTTEHPQDEPASNPVEPSPDGATSSRPVDVPRSPMLRAMVALLRTGLRRSDTDGAHLR